MKFIILTIVFFSLMIGHPLLGCKLWAVRTKSNLTFTSMADQEIQNINNQLTSFYYQSEYMEDGWALLGYSQTLSDSTVPLIRSSSPATTDSTLYWETVSSLLNNENGTIGIGHLRIATSGTNTIPNPHPWMFYDEDKSYSLIHNGTINKNILYNLLTNNDTDLSWLEMHEPQTFGGGHWNNEGWDNVVDSELLLLYLMKQINLEGDILSGIQTALIYLLNTGIYASQVNIIFSDGITLYAFGGYNGLYFTESTEHYSIMTSPDNDSNNSWLGLEGHELITFGLDSITRYPNFVSAGSGDISFINASTFEMQPAYPNPFNGSVQFVLEGFTSNKINISILSLYGAKIDEFIVPELNNEKRTISWSPRPQISSGMYIIYARSSMRMEKRKILFIK